MDLATQLALYKRAESQGWALAQFNAENLEFAQAILTAADARRAPVIVAASPKTLAYMTAKTFAAMVRAVAEETDVPVILHLDHGESVQMVKNCLNAGFDSVMIDGSTLSFEENIRVTSEAAAFAHDRGALIEGELGHVAGKAEDEGQDAPLTDPAQAVEFVERSGVDTLAIAVGTSHGAYKFPGEAKLHLERIEQIRSVVKAPLVLHGASGVQVADIETVQKFGGNLKGAAGLPDERVQEAVRAGISKVNVATEMRISFLASLRRTFGEQPSVIDPRKYLGEARSAIQKIVEDKLDVLGASNRA